MKEELLHKLKELLPTAEISDTEINEDLYGCIRLTKKGGLLDGEYTKEQISALVEWMES